MLSCKGRKRTFDEVETDPGSCTPSGFRIIDIGMLQAALDEALICGHGKLTICDVPDSNMNLYSAFKIQCKVCSLSSLFSNSSCSNKVMDCRLNVQLNDLLTETYFRTLVDYFDAERNKKLPRPEDIASCKQTRNDDYYFYIERLDDDNTKKSDDNSMAEKQDSKVHDTLEDNTVKSEPVDVVIYEDEDVVVKTECEELVKKQNQDLDEEEEELEGEEEELEGEEEEKFTRLEVKREEEEESESEDQKDEKPEINPQKFLSVEEDLSKTAEDQDELHPQNTKICSFKRTEGGMGPFLFTKNRGRVMLYENYLYKRNQMAPERNRIYWKCVKRHPTCKGNLRTTFFDANEVSHPGNEVVQESTPHNHDPPESVCTLLFVNAVKEKIAEDVDQDLKNVYKSAVKEYDNGMPVPRYMAVRQQLVRFRNSLLQSRGLGHELLEESCIIK